MDFAFSSEDEAYHQCRRVWLGKPMQQGLKIFSLVPMAGEASPCYDDNVCLV
jgi:hypothetical protein